MARGKRAEVTIKIPPMAKRDFEKFLERLSKALYGDTVVGTIRGDTIKLYIYGSRLTVERTVRLVKQLIREYSTPETPRGRAYSLRALSREAGTAIPPDVLVEVLRARGHKAWVDDGRIVTSADQESVVGAARLVAKAVRSLEKVYAARTVKKALAAILALHPDLPPSAAVRILVETGGAGYDEEGKLVPRRDWREALKEALKTLEEPGGD